MGSVVGQVAPLVDQLLQKPAADHVHGCVSGAEPQRAIRFQFLGPGDRHIAVFDDLHSAIDRYNVANLFFGETLLHDLRCHLAARKQMVANQIGLANLS